MIILYRWFASRIPTSISRLKAAYGLEPVLSFLRPMDKVYVANCSLVSDWHQLRARIKFYSSLWHDWGTYVPCRAHVGARFYGV